MSRIGKKPITIPSGVSVDLQDGSVKIKGPKGELTLALHPKVKLTKQDSGLIVNVSNKQSKQEKALWGLFRALVSNMVTGVTTGFTKQLEINGVGYKASIVGRKLILNLGYSHPVELTIPDGLEAKIEKNIISISGPDKQAVGQFAAQVRGIRPPEPYKGKGIKYSDEVIRRKAGKVVKAVGAGK